jgi:hypothetical protein
MVALLLYLSVKSAQRFAIPAAFGSSEQVACQTTYTEKYHTSGSWSAVNLVNK